MNKAESKNHIFFEPHRDDLLLTFGGRLIELLEKGESVTNHLIYGRDGFIRPAFLRKLSERDAETHAYLKNISQYTGKEEIYDWIVTNLQSQSIDRLDSESITDIGIAIRLIEERACMQYLGVHLIEHDQPCAYPLRGYKTFNEDNPTDIATQTELQFHQIVLPAVLSGNLNSQYYFLSGIGGHPDHRILAASGTKVAQYTNKDQSVSFGQDLPYAAVLEWFRRSDLALEQFDIQYTDISHTLLQKIDLLERFYKSQLSPEDLRVVEMFHRSIVNLMSREYCTDILAKQGIEIDKVTAIECRYGTHA